MREVEVEVGGALVARLKVIVSLVGTQDFETHQMGYGCLDRMSRNHLVDRVALAKTKMANQSSFGRMATTDCDET